MSESIVRKIQPFTIGTKLSTPDVPKCPSFTFSDDCKLQRRLNEQVSLYLGRSQVYDRRCGPPTAPVTPVKHQQEEMSDEEHLNTNTVSPNAASRSIRKITISGSGEAGSSPGMQLKINPNSENINNNNNITNSKTVLPKIVGVCCENKPNSQLKVLLCKDAERQRVGDREKISSFPQTQTAGADVLKVNTPSSSEHKDVSLVTKVLAGQIDHSFAQQNVLFNREITQAEIWIRGRLRDLRDSSHVQRCLQKDWDEACQTLQRDLKDFENTLIQLNQMGEQLMWKVNPTSDLVKKRLAQLRDQWSTLKQTTANQIKAMGGAKSLQEFNVKVDRLESWIKEKEEERTLANILGENIDKMQLTRKILDLKQDEQLYRNLHEDINHMALRLEKQGKTDGKTISTRRKHINKMWLKAQSHLKDYHENLQLALDVSSFHQQADNIICSINNMRKSLSRNDGAGEIRDIASQIMMLDVTVSQLSNLHPALAARVTQKQSEMKDCWALFQKTVRNEKAAQLSSAPSLTRESRDPQTPSQEPPGSVGTDPGRTMGKVEQNRLKGFVGGRDIERCRKPSDSQDDPQKTAEENSIRTTTSDVIVRLQTSNERNPARFDSRGHPALQTQLQKFTASADKTLSWLKESIAMATQICNMSGPQGLEVAKRRQASLDQDIRSNRARIELVKREGHSLVKAEHPGSSRIQEFVRELEVLWDELIRKHQRNALVLQVSEELNHKVLRVLQSLCSLEAWLEAVELSITQASLAGDPESVSVAEQESSQLEQELESRGLELHDLRQEVDHLSNHKHLHTQLLPARLKEVEKKFSSVQSALTQQSSELKDTRMLTEFLEKVELEESQYGTLGQPLCSDVDPLGLPGSTHGELIETIGNPGKELREAVEMLNDTARERGRSQTHDQSIQDLLSRHSEFSARVERCLQRCAELAADVLEMESEMAVRCEPDRCGLDRLQETQDQLEAEYEMLRERMEAMESQAERLSDVCLERMRTVSAEILSSLNSWDELGKSLAENRKRLLQFEHLRSFFRNYLAMISWTEDTRSCIFSESARRQSRENQQPLVEVLDQQIEQKFEEFDRLVVDGKKLFDKEHHLNKMIGERMEELRSMLGWILVHWRAQKNQLLTSKKAGEAQADAIYSELETSPENSQKRIEQVTCAPPTDPEERLQHSDEYEVMKIVSPRGSDVIICSERPDSPYLVLKGPSPPALGGTVNLILSFSNSVDTQLQVQTPGGEEGVTEPEPVHRPAESHSSARKSLWKRCQGLFGSLKRKKKFNGHSAEEVSTYLHVTDNSVAVAPVYESMTLPRDKSPRPSSSSSCTFPYSSSSNQDALKQSNNSSIHLLPKNTNISIFSSLKRKSKKRKKKKDDRRHTIQRIMGEEEEEAGPTPVCEPAVYETWPLKERRKRKNARKPNSDGAQVLDYVKNPLEKDIDVESSGEVGSPVRCAFEDPKVSSGGHVKNHCRFLSLGSVLSFDLSKDTSLIPSIQDVITICHAEGKKTSCDLQESPTALSTFKMARSVPTRKEEPKRTSSGEITLRIDCKDARNISVDTDVSFTEDEFPPPPSPVIEDISFEETDIPMNRLSGISRVTQEDQCSWGAHETHLESKDFNVSPPEDAANRSSTTAGIRTLLHKPAKTSHPARESPIPLQASHMVLNFKTNRREDSVDSGHSSSGSFKLDTSDCPASKKIVKLPSMDTNISNVKKFECSKEKTPSVDDPVHPDHQQFEQEEEELEDIWNHTNTYRQSVCSDIMYRGYQTSSPDQQRAPSPKEQAALFRKLVTASAPNLLVAEFRLPQSVQPVVGCGTRQNLKEETCTAGRRDRRSWAAFTQQEQVYKQVAVNETASDPVRLPVIDHQNKYIYHYREEEEEEEEDGFAKDQSVSLLSLQMGLEGSANDSDIQIEKQELPSMEGTLERKQKLQLGGKRASCRGWSSYHAVLYKRTMCFYQDRKDALKSCVTSLPLNLIGGVCEPSPEYTKKPNCFCLRLRDGSEYLLSASSRFMMRKWILRIQEHATCGESGVNISARHNPSADAAPLRRSPQTDSSHNTDECQSPVRSYVTSTVLAQSQSTSGRSKEIIVHAGDGVHIHQRHQELSSTSSSHAGHCEDEFRSHGQNLHRQNPTGVHSSSILRGWTSEKRRSHSFTSATYQRIKPVLAPPAGRDQHNSSSYSVTLFIGDRERTSGMAEPDGVSQDFSSDVPLRSYMSLPRPRNKSVFRKFFGKKE
ncbi:uncharacterized protein LOC130431430 isoform X2 [Triplophysa dalaica]|uniref:uncharacterized protein LOC130431430 isoform X2 n=1 Tax=Triplophysa dalaica TaxID=1582913 RepID=UPI0024DF9D57|nr:uncharacterized protein LOC130431430 isoform X2 [Triplophysa dalaica]